MARFSGGLSTRAATSWDRFTPPPTAGDSGGECSGEDSADLDSALLLLLCGDDWPAAAAESAASRNLCVIWCCFMLPCRQRAL